MPYTASHVIAVAPIWYLAGRRIPLSALAIGAVSPDFPYLLHLTPVHAPGHAAAGLLTHCLAPSLVLLLIWHRWLEEPMLGLLGIRTPKRTHSLPVWLGLCVLGVLAGGATHQLWDAMTHPSGWLVQRFAWPAVTWWSLPMYKWAQYASGVAGLLGLVVWHWRSVSARASASPYPPRYTLAAAVFPATTIAFVVLANWIHETDSIHYFIVRSSIGVITGLFVGCCLYAVVVRRSPAALAHAGPHR